MTFIRQFGNGIYWTLTVFDHIFRLTNYKRCGRRGAEENLIGKCEQKYSNRAQILRIHSLTSVYLRLT